MNNVNFPYYLEVKMSIPNLEKCFLEVQKPGRYTGGEQGSVIKDKLFS